MVLRLVAGATAAAVAATGVLLSTPPTGADSVRPERGAKSTWTEADKSGFGTARATGSNVWFTLQGGRVSEVFHPDLSTPSVRSLEFVVTDGERAERTSTDTRTTVHRPDEGSLRFVQENVDEDGRYQVTEEYVTDPRHDTLVVKVRLTSLDGGDYRLWVRHDPALANGGMDDRARGAGRTLIANDGTVATALAARPALRQSTSGLVGTPSDPWRDLRADGDLDHRRTSAGPGNVVQAARLADSATLVLGFGPTGRRARAEARATLRTGFTPTATAYDDGWHGYLDALAPVPASAADVRREYLASALVLAAAEDKLHRGALIASPSAPWVWGDEVKDLSSPSGAYHLVWSRDSYQFATALWAMGDRPAARRTVRWLFGTQQQPDGSFPQNSHVDGTPVWSELQLDEVALPIVLAHLVGADDAATWRGVRKAARFLVTFEDEETGRRAPYSPQERWENQAGYSPNSIATQIAGLVTAAAMARDHDRADLAREWLDVADRWQRRVKRWTVTTNGPLSDAPYFLRLTKNGRPDTASPYEMGDGGPVSIDQRRVVDPSFLDLVRLGILPGDDRAVVNTLDVVDEQLSFATPNGTFWRRFSHDGYGETRSSGQWILTDPGDGRTLGRGWPILTGERGEYAVVAGQDATGHLATVAAAAGAGDMISEQVWDGRPPTGEACCAAGEGTRAATPLVWSHAQLVRLAWTIERGIPVDQQPVVAKRYVR